MNKNGNKTYQKKQSNKQFFQVKYKFYILKNYFNKKICCFNKKLH